MLQKTKICLVLIFSILVYTPTMAYAAEGITRNGLIGTENETYHLDRYEVTYVNIYGHSNLEKRQDITITIKYPNEMTEKHSIPSTNKGIFTYSFMLDKNSQPGTYFISGLAEKPLGQVSINVIPLSDNFDTKIQTSQNIQPNLIISTNLKEYSEGDTIMVKGSVTNANSGVLGLEIFSPNGQRTYADRIIINEGIFSTAVKASGHLWSESGEYIIRVFDGKQDKEIIIWFNTESVQETFLQQINEIDYAEILSVDNILKIIFMNWQNIMVLGILLMIIGAIARKFSKSRSAKNINMIDPVRYTPDSLSEDESKPAANDTISNVSINKPSDTLQKNTSTVQNSDTVYTSMGTTHDQNAKESLSNQQNSQSSQKIIQREKYIIIPDTNICLNHNEKSDEYSIQFFAADTRFLILDVVKREAKRVISHKKLTYIPTSDMHENPTQNILNTVNKLQKLIKIDFDKHLKLVKNMYNEINLDENFVQQRIRWHYIKNKNPNPVPPYKINDSRYDQNILAKASWLASVNKDVTVVLLTNDSDFVSFPYKIRETLNVHVLYGYKYWEEIANNTKDPIDDIVNMNQVDLLEFYDIIGPDGKAKKRSNREYSD